MENFSRPVIEEGPSAANPALFPNTVYNAASGQVAMVVGLIGPTTTVTAGHAASSSGFVYSFDVVTCRRADVMVSLAADTLTDTVIRAYRELGFLLPEGGPALAEAGIALVLEGLDQAQARGAHIYGEVLGYAITSDALGIGTFDAQGSGLERAMRLALDHAGMGASDITTVWASSTGNTFSDAAEEQALKRLFGDSVPVMAPKKLLGEPIGAGGTLNAALAMKMWQRGHGTPGPVMVNSCSAGGTNISFVLAPVGE
jgi:3-oxoacyl-[acyl-carrier-protein] synthase II